MARKKAKSKVQKLPSITSTDDELQQTTDKTDGSEEGTSVASLKSSSTCQTNDHSDTSRLNHTATISYSSSRPHSLADDISQLSSIDTIDLDLDTDTIVALEDMDEPSGSNGPGPSRVKKHQKLQDKLPAKPKATKTAATVKAAAPAVYTLPPGTILDPNSLSARQPVDPIKEPLRAAALLEVEAGREGQKYLDAAAEWRAELNQKRDKWLEDHADEIYTNKLRHQFLGWVELEADPDYFTIMLKRLGIERAQVVEVHSLDEMLSSHHCLKYGIMVLSRYHDEGLESSDEGVPEDLWFSNQIIDNACATVAILNIINNVKTLDLGENLKSFKNFTKTFHPVLKGEALANFSWCRSIHNAFAKRTEILAANLALQQEATSKMSKSAKRRKNKARGKAKATKNETPNHYVAYVPLAGDLWKLDGMDMHPRNLGPIGDGEAWINTVRDDIEKRMAVFANDESAGYTVLGIVEDKLPALIDMLGRNVNHLNWVEFCISEKRDYWNRSIATEPEENTWAIGHEPIRAPDIRFDLTQKILDSKGVCFTYAQKKDISTCSEEHLNWIRPDIVEEQLHLRELILPLKEEREAQWAKYKDRMFDYGPVIHQWLKFLHENGNLAPLIDAHLKAQKEDQN